MSRRSAFIPLFFIIFLDSMGYGLVIPVLLRMLMGAHQHFLGPEVSMHLRSVIFGVGVALSPLATLIAAPLVGGWSDHIGRRKMLLFCLCGAVFGFVLPIVGVSVLSLSLVLIGRFIVGVATCSRPIAQAAVTDISSGREKAFLLSMIAFAMTLAMVAGPLLGGYLSDAHLVSWFGVSTPFIAAALLSLLNIVLLQRYFHETQAATPHDAKHFSWRQTLTEFIRRPGLRVLLLIFFCYEFSWSLYFQDISLYLNQSLHYAVDATALFIAYAGLWMCLGLTVIYRWLIRYMALQPILLVCLLVACLGYFSCGIFKGEFVQWLSVIPIALAVGMIYPTLLAMMSNQTEQSKQGWVMGLASSALSLSWMMSGMLMGWLNNIDALLPLQVAAFVMLLVLFVCALQQMLTRRPVWRSE